MQYKKIVKKMLKRLPKQGRPIKDIYSQSRHLSRNFLAKFRAMTGNYHIPNPDTIYWINPDRIVFHTNYNPSGKDIPFRDRIFNPDSDRGKILDGDWDISDFKFIDLDVYKAIEARMLHNAKWQNTKFYRRVLDDINSGNPRWHCDTKEELDKRCDYIDRLIESIRKDGYKSSDEVQIEPDKDFSAKKEEVTVNIGRNGEFLFENGRHRLSIAKILKIPKIPVKIIVRHREWQEFREYVLRYAKISGGTLYQPPIHPDLSDIPAQHECDDRFDAIVKNIDVSSGGKLLDIGAYFGYFCHKFENFGFDCYAVELFPELSYIMNKIKIAEGKKFSIIEKSIFDTQIIDNTKFDIVLALNIFHHFLKTEDYYNNLTYLLKRINTNIIIFEPHLPNEPQMKNAYKNYDVNEFVDFILKYSPLNNSALIFTADDGRKIFKLYK